MEKAKALMKKWWVWLTIAVVAGLARYVQNKVITGIEKVESEVIHHDAITIEYNPIGCYVAGDMIVFTYETRNARSKEYKYRMFAQPAIPGGALQQFDIQGFLTVKPEDYTLDGFWDNPNWFRWNGVGIHIDGEIKEKLKKYDVDIYVETIRGDNKSIQRVCLLTKLENL